MPRFARPRVAIVDDDPLLRLALTTLLRQEGMEVVAALPAGPAAVPALAELEPELAIVGVDPAAGLLRHIAATLPSCRAFVLDGRLRGEVTVDELIERVREALGVTADPP